MVNIFISQLENRSSVTAANITTTTAITNYIPVLMTAPAGVPRLDYNPTTGQALGLLIEESRTNLLTYSGDFSNAAWIATATITSNTATAPDGTITADRIAFTSSADFIIQQYNTTTPLTAYTFSVYLKANSPVSVIVNIQQSGGGNANNTVNVTTLWQRFNVTYITDAIPTFVRARIIPNANTPTIYAWGAQLEAGSFATSYIPTTSAAVTRTADQASMTGTNFSSWYNQAQGSLYVDFDLIGLQKASQGMDIVNVLNASGYGVELYNNTTGTIISSYLGVSNSGVINPPAINTKYQALLAYTQTNLNTCINGATPITLSGTLPASIISLGLGFAQTTNANYMSGHIRKINYYATALPSAVLQALTS